MDRPAQQLRTPASLAAQAASRLRLLSSGRSHQLSVSLAPISAIGSIPIWSQ